MEQSTEGREKLMEISLYLFCFLPLWFPSVSSLFLAGCDCHNNQVDVPRTLFVSSTRSSSFSSSSASFSSSSSSLTSSPSPFSRPILSLSRSLGLEQYMHRTAFSASSSSSLSSSLPSSSSSSSLPSMPLPPAGCSEDVRLSWESSLIQACLRLKRVNS